MNAHTPGPAVGRMGPISRERKQAIRRCALKRWLRAHGVSYRERDMYSESALRKLVRDHEVKAVRMAETWPVWLDAVFDQAIADHIHRGEQRPEADVEAIERARAAVAALFAKASALVAAVDDNHDNKPAPQRYTVPWDCVTELRAALTAFGGAK